MSQSQYATTPQLQLLAITPAVFARFEAASPGCSTAALQAASSICDSYLVSQFTLPLAISPQGWDMSLTMNTCWIAAWLLYNQFGYNPAAPVDDLIVKRYEAAIDWLKQIRDKQIFPVWVDSSANTGTDEAGTFFVSDPPIGFTPRGIGQPDTGEYQYPAGFVPNGGWFWGWEP